MKRITLYKKPNKRIICKNRGKLHWTIWILLIICLLCGIRYYSYCVYNGPKLGSHTYIGYYGHRHLSSINVHGLREQKAANKIYITRHQIDWNHPYYINNRHLYFPKNMPKQTRKIIIKYHD